MESLSQFCHQSIPMASANSTHTLKNISWYLHKAIDIPHTANSSCPTTHTPVWLPAQKNPNHTLQSFPQGNTILCYSPHDRKWSKMVHSSPTIRHFRPCCSETSKGRCLHHQGFLCIKGLHLYIFIYFSSEGRLKYSPFYTLIKMMNSLNTLCLQRPPGIKCMCSFFHEHSTRYYVRKKILAVYLGPK